MPAGRRRQSNAMLYTLVAFVGLFIIATTIAVIYYVRAEEYRTKAQEAEQEMEKVATRDEIRRIGAVVGTDKPGSYLGTMVTYLDRALTMVIGAPLSDESAEVKLDNAVKSLTKTLTSVGKHLVAGNPDPNTTGLVAVATELSNKLDNTLAEKTTVQGQLDDLRKRFDESIAQSQKDRAAWLAEKAKFEQQVADIQGKYAELEALVQQQSDERTSTLRGQLDQTRAELRTANDDILKLRAELEMARERLRNALDQVDQIQAPPDHEAMAYDIDARVILVDRATNMVHLDIGANDRVYRGLTFSVYDKATSIPTDGKPKTEIEVFDIQPKTCVARILAPQKKDPVATGDLVANLIWSSKKTNRFVVAGEFDLDRDGRADYDAVDRIKALIAKWGGTTDDAVSAETDYVILGNEPFVPKKPAFEDLEVDPLANETYDKAVRQRDYYRTVQGQAQALWIPIFTFERFLHFTGYTSMLTKPGAI